VQPEAINTDTNLYDELEIESIDGVDLMVQIKQETGKKIPPEAFRDVRSIRNLLDALQGL
jgi:acyl carrier protein